MGDITDVVATLKRITVDIHRKIMERYADNPSQKYILSGGGMFLVSFAAACGRVRNMLNITSLEGALQRLIKELDSLGRPTEPRRIPAHREQYQDRTGQGNSAAGLRHFPPVLQRHNAGFGLGGCGSADDPVSQNHRALPGRPAAMWAFSRLPLLGTHTARLSAPSPGRQDGRILAQTGADGSLWPGFRQLVQRLAFGWIGFRKAFWWVRDDLLYLTEPTELIGRGGAI